MSDTMSISEFRALQIKSMSHQTIHRHIEHDMQVACVWWFRAQYHQYRQLFWSVPNGGYRSVKTACEMKAEGQMAGVPDLFLAYPANGYHGLFIEMKKSRVGKRGKLIRKGRLSDKQQAVISRLVEVGYKVEVCYSFEQFKTIINNYLP